MTSLRRRLERRDEREAEREQLEAEKAIREAQSAPIGSIAARNNPLRFGSAFRRQNASLARAYDNESTRAMREGEAAGLDTASVNGLRRRALTRSPWR